MKPPMGEIKGFVQLRKWETCRFSLEDAKLGEATASEFL